MSEKMEWREIYGLDSIAEFTQGKVVATTDVGFGDGIMFTYTDGSAFKLETERGWYEGDHEVHYYAAVSPAAEATP